MTGYGKAELELDDAKLSIEIKSLNSKQLDLNIRIPYSYNEKEMELRSILSKKLERGKISVFINREVLGESSNHKINKTLAKYFYKQVQEVAQEVGNEHSEEIMSIVMRLPDVVKQVNEEVKDKDWKQLLEVTKNALDHIDEFRLQEGTILEADFSLRIGNILELLGRVEEFESRRIIRIKERLQQSLIKQIDESKIDKDRFEQELIFYLEKFDITEEKVRLRQHCDYFIETLDNKFISKGKKLGFITQEIGREINTLGSKANDSDLQKIVVQMKDELEKIKEQALNIL